jgi:hypothetical protein
MLFDEFEARLDYEAYEQRVADLQLERRALKARREKSGAQTVSLAYRRVVGWLENAWSARKPAAKTTVAVDHTAA